MKSVKSSYYLVAFCAVLVMAVVPVASCPDTITYVGANYNPSITGEAPLTVTFTPVVEHTFSAYPLICNWAFGDGTSSPAMSCTDPVTHTFTTAGSFDITLMATSSTCYPTYPISQMTRTMPGWVKVTAAPTTGTLTVTSSPSGASFYLSEVYKGTTPLTLHDLSPGSYTGRFSLSGYDDVSQSVIVKAGDTNSCTATLPISAPTTGSINVLSTPSGADVYIDDTYIGTILASFPLLKTGLSPGIHTVRLTLDGYDDYTKTVTVNAGQATEVSATLSKSSSSTFGSLEIKSVPSGASVTLNEGSQGTTPVIVGDLSPGKYTVGLTKSGYDYYSGPVTVVAGKRTTVTITLGEKSGGSTDDDESVTTTKEDSASTTGSIHVESTPSGASVNVDGWDKGTTPVTVSQVKAGSHTVTVKLAGYTDYTKTIEVKSGYKTSVKVPLTQAGGSQTGSGTLTIRSTPSGATVYIDGDSKGTTPLHLQNVPAGSHKVLLTLQGYGDSSQTVEMTGGSDKDVSISLAKATPGFAPVLSVAALGLIVLALGWKRRGR